MGRGIISIFSLLTAAFTGAAWAPWTPRLDDLSMETAYVREFTSQSSHTEVMFATEGGQLLVCSTGWKGPKNKCPTHPLQEALVQQTPLTVWHDSQVVYQADLAGRRIIDYSSAYTGERWWAAALAFVSSIPLLIALGRRMGFINQ